MSGCPVLASSISSLLLDSNEGRLTVSKKRGERCTARLAKAAWIKAETLAASRSIRSIIGSDCALYGYPGFHWLDGSDYWSMVGLEYLKRS